MQDHTPDSQRMLKSEAKQISEHKEKNPGFTRRRFLAGGTAIVGSVVLAGYGQASGASEVSELIEPIPSNVVPGNIERIVMPDTLYVSNSEGQATIMVSGGTEFHRFREGAVSGISDFFVGDDIIAEGGWEGKPFAATLLTQMLRLVEGLVVSRNGDKLTTVNGIVRLGPDTITESFSDYLGKPVDEITVGDYVYGQAWRDPFTSELVALRISVKRV